MPHSRARPIAPPVHLGAFVHPFGPLPLPRNRTVARATLYIPALALPRVRPVHPRVWGNGPYTDDSDIISAAVHAGRVRWSEVSEASRRGQDARVEVQVVPAAERYFGSVGSAPEPGSGGEPDDDGRGFFSAGWGNGHEGAGIEILDVVFVKVGHAYSFVSLCVFNFLVA
jgi:Histone deacetylation protein Rxt3